MSHKRVLVTPLDWGLGHATRCIPIIRELLVQGCFVWIAGSGKSLILLKSEFPQLPSQEITPYAPEYPVDGSMIRKMIIQIPKFLRVIQQEHNEVRQIIRKHHIDLIISDNRYGCWSEEIPCIFITHQSNILMPRRFGWLSFIVRYFNQKMMQRFTVCWIPDFNNEKSLAGKLMSFGKIPDSLNVEFIGPLSHFSDSREMEMQYDLAVVLSGPEPQRTILEKKIVEQLSNIDLKAILIRGIPGEKNHTRDKTFDQVDFMGTAELQEILLKSRIIIARSGYSTVMDMARLNKRVIFIPTPGQTEQEYLAQKLLEAGIAFSMTQNHFDLITAIKETEAYSGFQDGYKSDDLLKKVIQKALHEKVS